MPLPENTERILSRLQDFRGIEPLRQLFWVELNYNRDNTPIENLPEGAANLVAEVPIRFATGGKNKDFPIIYVKLKAKKLRKTDERQIITHLQTPYPDALYVFSNSDQDHWHFINVKFLREKKEDGDQQREIKQRNVFRRITIAPNERLRTAAERIAMLDIKEIGEPDGLFSIQDILTSLDIRKGHEEAFNVEAVTKAFFESYKSIFKRLQTELKHQNSDEKWAHDFSQQFLTRCIFLYFVQRKGWLGDDTDFLHTFWQAYQDISQPTNTFVEKWLNVLFFEAFNNRFHGGHTYFPSEIREILQLAPYLNGGLFRENELDTEYIVNVPDDLWQQIFTFLEQYNFTIAEDTPLDQEVAVDPEMIGKVYESLVSAEDEERGDAGIFYTPRVEIDLMCRLALVDNLANHIGTEEDKHRFYEALFAFEPDEKREVDVKLTDLWEAIYKHLTEITVLDPACGSGSFLVGMLHVLDDVRERAEHHLGFSDASRFERRKALIGKNLYGVDVKQWACKVAELRLWLALIIDAEFTTAELKVRPEPLLPDFSFNIRHGDSIVQDIGGMNLAQTRDIGNVVSSSLNRKITNLKNEKLKFYNNDPDRKYTEKKDVQEAENFLFQERLHSYDVEISREIRKVIAWLEDPTEQLPLLDIEQTDTQELDRQTQQKKNELLKHQENLAQVQRARRALSSITKPPFVWDIAFVEIFNQREGFDIVVENPPYIRQERIADPTIPRVEVTTANKKEYKAKLARSIYQAFPEFFGYRENRNAVKHKLNAKSDLYVYFYFHGLSLLNTKGTFCTITSKSWLDVGYGKDLQEFLLKQCYLKMVLDNSVKRSFATADVNTVICLISAPNRNQEICLQHTARFVNFTVPFEAILDAVIFYEIETVTGRVSTFEHKIHPLSQKTLLVNGMGKKAKYIGDKWGGKYLRAPNIYWCILEKGKSKLERLGDITNVRMGIKTGANEFFVLDPEAISEWNIEAEFLQPVISTPREVKSMLICKEQLSHQLFICSKEKNDLIGTSALEYIEWGESLQLHKRPSTRNRRRWYDVGERPPPHMVFQKLISSTLRTLYAPDRCYVTNKFAEINTSADMRIPLCLSLNSTLLQLMVNVNGRSNLGGGALAIEIYEIENLPCVNPTYIISEGNINQTFLESEEWDVLEPSEARRKIDEIIFDILELTQGERDGVYEAVTQLVTTRLQKAKT